MIKLEKRLAPFCENCEKFVPCSMKVLNKKEGNEIDVTAVIICANADICINAVNMYDKFNASCSKPPITNNGEISNIKFTGAALMPDGSIEMEGLIK